MKKLLTKGAALVLFSFLTVVSNAKNYSAISISSLITNDLSDRLAADKDFQEFSFLIYDFTAKVRTTKSGELVLNYFGKKTTEEESKTMLDKLGFFSKSEFQNYWKKIYQLKASFQSKFTELHDLPDVSEIVKIAAQRVALEKGFYKNSNSAKLPASVCWLNLVVETNNCTLIWCYNAEDWEGCMAACVALSIASSGICFLFAD